MFICDAGLAARCPDCVGLASHALLTGCSGAEICCQLLARRWQAGGRCMPVRSPKAGLGQAALLTCAGHANSTLVVNRVSSGAGFRAVGDACPASLAAAWRLHTTSLETGPATCLRRVLLCRVVVLEDNDVLHLQDGNFAIFNTDAESSEAEVSRCLLLARELACLSCPVQVHASGYASASCDAAQ